MTKSTLFLRRQARFDEDLNVHVLDGKPVTHFGELELRLRDGHWTRVIYMRRSPSQRKAKLVLLLSGEHSEAELTLRDDMELRWLANTA